MTESTILRLVDVSLCFWGQAAQSWYVFEQRQNRDGFLYLKSGKFLFMSCVWVVMKSQVSSLQYYDNITKKLHFTFFHCFSASSAPIPSVLVAIDSCACNTHSVTWFISNTFVCILQSTNVAASMGRSRRDALVICSTSGRIITSYRPYILLLCRLQQGK